MIIKSIAVGREKWASPEKRQLLIVAEVVCDRPLLAISTSRSCPASRPDLRLILKRECKDRIAGSDYHLLLASAQITDWVRVHRRARLEMPKRTTRCGVEREKVAFIGTSEHQIARGGEYAGLSHGVQFEFPFQLASVRIHRADGAHRIFANDWALPAAVELRARLVFRVPFEEHAAYIPRGDEEQVRLRTIGGTEPVRTASHIGVYLRSLNRRL